MDIRRRFLQKKIEKYSSDKSPWQKALEAQVDAQTPPVYNWDTERTTLFWNSYFNRVTTDG